MSSFQNTFKYNIGDVVYSRHNGRIVKTIVEEVMFRRIQENGETLESNAYHLKTPKNDNAHENYDSRTAFIVPEQNVFATFEEAVSHLSQTGGFMFATPNEITDFDFFKHSLIDATIEDKKEETETKENKTK